MTAVTMTHRLRKKPRDVRPLAAGLLLLLVLLVGGLLQWNPASKPSELQTPAQRLTVKPDNHPAFTRDESPVLEERVWKAPEAPINPLENPEGHDRQARMQEALSRFDQATVMLHAQRFDDAIVALNRVLDLVPQSSDAQVNLGYALVGKQLYPEALQAFERAMDLNPTQANAYYGAAIAMEAMGNLEGALGGMRSFLHLTDKGPGHIHVGRARSAIWEWESQLGRGPWGPTRGIPPGFTKEELKRDGRGVGIKMQIPGTEDENGMLQYEIKAQDKFRLFER